MELSAVVIAQNEGTRLRPCLESLAFADEIIVVDGGSRDDTIEVARSYGARVVEQPFVGWRTARVAGLERARGEWILAVDADERVPAGLASEIRGALAHADASLHAFRIPVKTYYRERWLRHGGFWPARRVRLFRRELGSYAPQREVHEQIMVPGQIGTLQQPLEHRSFSSLPAAMSRVQRYAEFAARDLHARGRHSGALRAGGHAAARFLRGYLLRGGFLDGVPGLWFAALGAYETLAKYVTLWELGEGVRLPALKGSNGEEASASAEGGA